MTRVVGSPWMSVVAYFIKRGRPVMSPCGRRQERRGGEAVSIACGSGGVDISDGLDPVLALAAVAELHSMAHPNR